MSVPTIIFMCGIGRTYTATFRMATTVSVDEAGRVVIPKKVRVKLGIDGEGILSIEVRGSELILKRSGIEKSPAKAITKMSLPVGPWNKVEREIEEGASSRDDHDL
jgi:AbrB family looped-hinge helix DNA binding protein